jgi:ABC-type Zn uptake system ZnuABC Zn-binding protein ZnuA
MMRTQSHHKRYLLVATIIVLLGALTACQPAAPAPAALPTGATTAASAPALTVLAAESFISDMAQSVAGDRLQVETLMPLGLDPHAFEPTPQDVARIADSQVLIVNGGGFEEWLQEVLDNAGGQRQVIEASAGLASRAAREGEEAVMTDEERADAICAELAGQEPEELAAGADAASAAEMGEEHEGEGHEGEGHEHGMELLAVKLNPEAGGQYGGFITPRVHAEEGGDFVIATAGGALAISGPDGQPIAAEATLTLPDGCQGLAEAGVFELEPGEHLVQMSGFAGDSAPLLFGAAGGHHHHDAGDPHFWLNPVNAIAYVETIRDGLTAADPAGKEVYAANAAAYIAQLQELDAFIAQQVEQIPAERRQIVTNHESFGYFADRYGFTIIGTIVPSVSTGTAPSAQQLARLVDRIRATGAPAIFLETGANPQLADQLAQETGIRVVTDLFTHSITPADGLAPTYIAMMRHNTQAIVDALK